MKPRIARYNGVWLCHGLKVHAWGASPAQAYLAWQKRYIDEGLNPVYVLTYP